MAIRKCRLIKQMEDGSHDTIHMETDSTIVQRPDGSSVEAALAACNTTCRMVVYLFLLSLRFIMGMTNHNEYLHFIGGVRWP